MVKKEALEGAASVSRLLSSRRTFIQSALTAGTATAAGAFSGAPVIRADRHGARSAAQTGVVAHTNSDVVETVYGKVRGSERNGIRIFRGIPYGADTGGQNRFLPARPPEGWAGVLPTLWYGPACPWAPRAQWAEHERAFVQQWEDGYGRGENLLLANVWTPGINDSKKRPVMVWVHGGGYSWGSSYELPAYDGENLARRGDFVVVSLHHRLSTFGFLNLSELNGSRFAHSHNLGMSDIVFLLEWVRDNVANFGGDPGNVTIVGQSGGGGKVSILLSMPSAKGLFHKACVHSGSTLRLPETDKSLSLSSAVLAELNVSAGNADVLQSISSEQLLNAALAALTKVNAPLANAPTTPGRNPRLSFSPYVDGEVIPQQPFDPGAPVVSADVPMFVCNTLNEFIDALDKPDAFSMTADELSSKISAVYGNRAAEIIAVFRKGHPKANNFQLWSIISASGATRANAVKQCQRKAALQKASVYNCWWQWQTPILDGRPMALHAGDLAFFFHNLQRCEAQTGDSPEARTLADQMSEAWIHFARTGDPNHPGIPKWSPVTPNGSETMIFNAPCVFSKDPDSDERRILERSSA